MGKKIVNSIIFLAGLAAILVLTSHFLKPNDDVYNTNGVMAKKEEFQKETNDTIDVVFIGDSEAYSAYNPMQLYGNYGFTSYVLATSAQRLCDTYSILKSMYKTQTPEYIFIETNCFFRFGGSVDDTKDRFMNFVLNRIPAMKYHTRLKNFFFDEKTKDHEYMKGFVLRNNVEPYTGGEWMQYTNEAEPVDECNVEYINKIVTLAKEHNTKIIFVSTPSTECHSYKKHNAVVNIANDYGIDYYDFNLVADKIGIDWSKDTRDGGNHLNFKGAIKVTDYLGKIMKSELNLKDHRNENGYEKWQNYYEKYLKKINEK